MGSEAKIFTGGGGARITIGVRRSTLLKGMAERERERERRTTEREREREREREQSVSSQRGGNG